VSLEEASTSFMIDSTLSSASAFAENLKISRQLLGRGIQPKSHPGIRKRVDFIFGLELLRKVPDESVVDVATT